jgi:pimeloyl-ACP methyl ester carboxylesterase
MPFARVNDIDLYYELAGRGPHLVMVPGLGATARACAPLAQQFQHRCTILLYDHRGVGLSSKPDARYSLATYASDLDRLLDHLCIEKTNLLGMSMGGIVAQQFVLDYPERVAKLVLVTTAGHITNYMHRIGLMLRALITYLPPEEFARTLTTLSFTAAFVQKEPETVAQVEHLLTPDPADVAGIKRQVSMLAAGDFSQRLAQISVPVLVIAGARDILTPLNYSQMLAAAIPGARLAVMQESAHNPLVEQSVQCTTTVLEFLEEPTMANTDELRMHERAG